MFIIIDAIGRIVERETTVIRDVGEKVACRGLVVANGIISLVGSNAVGGGKQGGVVA